MSSGIDAGSICRVAASPYPTYKALANDRQQKGAFRAPFYIGGSCRIRTCDQLIKSQLLYQLS